MKLLMRMAISSLSPWRELPPQQYLASGSDWHANVFRDPEEEHVEAAKYDTKKRSSRLS
jgi:hypothetical protein